MNGKVGMPPGKRYLRADDSIIVTIKNRFYEKVLLPNENGCMEWVGAINKLGYGSLANSGYLTAHRYSYFLHYGEFNPVMHVLHKCDNRKCVAPDHLFLGTHKENMIDMIRKNRLNNGKGETGHHHILNDADVIEIRKRLKNGETHRTIAESYGLHKTTITAINSGKNWKHLK